MATQRKFSHAIQYIGNPRGHARRKIGAGLAQHDRHTASHVFAAMRAYPFDHSQCATVAHGKTFACSPGSKKQAPGCAIEDRVSQDGILLRGKVCISGWSNDNLPARHAFANVVVRLSMLQEAHARHSECAKALARRSLKVTGDAHARKPHVAITPRNFSR